MAETQKLDVRPRTALGKKVNRLRREGRLPAVIYGGHADSVPVDTDAHTFEQGYRRWGSTTLLSLQLDGTEVAALVNGVSRDPRTGRMIHVDFARVSLTEKTTAEVPLHFVGESAAVKTQGGVLVHSLDHLRIEAYPQDMPHQIEVDLTPLRELDDTLHVRDLAEQSDNIRILNDPDELIVKTQVVRAEVERVATAATEAAAEAETTEADAEEAKTEKKT